jgi:O-antigen ligase
LGLENVRLWILKAIVVTLPIGWLELLPIPYAALTFVLIYLYLMCAALAMPSIPSFSTLKWYGFYLLSMWSVMFMSTYFGGGITVPGSASHLRQIIFFSVFFIFAVSDVYRLVWQGETMENYYLISMVGMAILYFSGFVTELADENSDRATLLGVNANTVALYSATSFVIFMDLFVRGSRNQVGRFMSGFSIPMMALLMYIIYRSGSRGGLIVLVVAVFIYFMGGKQISSKQFMSMILLAPFVIATLWWTMSTGVISERLPDLDDDIRLTALWPAALEIIAQYPVFGAGFDLSTLLMYQKIGFYIAPHNELLKITMASGIVGLVLFGLFLYSLLQSTLYFRQVTGSSLRISIFSLIALDLCKSGGSLVLPFIWVMFLLLSSQPSREEEEQFARVI